MGSILVSLRRRAAASLVGLAAVVTSTAALPYSDLVFFGDSLSDTGNVLSLTTAFSPPAFPAFPGAEGRFSNGPVWTESLAASLGFPDNAAPSNLLFAGASGVIPIGPQGGDNFAYGGARTGLSGAAGATTGLLGQLIAWNGNVFGTSLTRAADPNALYVLLAGANDMRDARTAFSGNTAADIAGRSVAAGAAATNIVNTMGLLAQAGARRFLVGNLANLGRTPEAAGLGLVAASTDASLRFNAALALGLSQLDSFFFGTTGIDLDIRSFDLFGLSDALALTPGAFGISNVTAPCINPVAPGAYFFPGSTDINCSVSAFSDALHPTTLVHQLIGQIAFNAAVPLPGSLGLMFLALVMMWGVRRHAVRLCRRQQILKQ